MMITTVEPILKHGPTGIFQIQCKLKQQCILINMFALGHSFQLDVRMGTILKGENYNWLYFKAVHSIKPF